MKLERDALAQNEFRATRRAVRRGYYFEVVIVEADSRGLSWHEVSILDLLRKTKLRSGMSRENCGNGNLKFFFFKSQYVCVCTKSIK